MVFVIIKFSGVLRGHYEKKFVFLAAVASAAAVVVVGVAAAVGAVRPFRAGRLSACARRVQQTLAAAVACGRSVHIQLLARCNVRAQPTAAVPTAGVSTPWTTGPPSATDPYGRAVRG